MALFERKQVNRGTISSPTLLDIQEFKTMKNIRSIKLADKGVKINYLNCKAQYLSYNDFIKNVNDRKL